MKYSIFSIYGCFVMFKHLNGEIGFIVWCVFGGLCICFLWKYHIKRSEIICEIVYCVSNVI